MVEFSHTFGCYIWTCDWGHRAIDFESEGEAIHDFKKHSCNMSI